MGWTRKICFFQNLLVWLKDIERWAPRFTVYWKYFERLLETFITWRFQIISTSFQFIVTSNRAVSLNSHHNKWNIFKNFYSLRKKSELHVNFHQGQDRKSLQTFNLRLWSPFSAVSTVRPCQSLEQDERLGETQQVMWDQLLLLTAWLSGWCCSYSRPTGPSPTSP